MKKQQAYNFYKFIMDKGYDIPANRKFRYGLVDISEIKTPEDIGITQYEFDEDGYLNVYDNVDLGDYGFTELPFKFGIVKGYFDCSHNKLTSLEGAPTVVKWDFNCSHNKLTSLEGAPVRVDGDFFCNNNRLTSLEWAPREVRWSFDCSYNQLTTLEGGPRKVLNFNCSNNQLTSLEGAPREVRGRFTCYDNPRKFSEEEVEAVSKVGKNIYV